MQHSYAERFTICGTGSANGMRGSSWITTNHGWNSLFGGVFPGKAESLPNIWSVFCRNQAFLSKLHGYKMSEAQRKALRTLYSRAHPKGKPREICRQLMLGNVLVNKLGRG
jgi:hypothetical protein